MMLKYIKTSQEYHDDITDMYEEYYSYPVGERPSVKSRVDGSNYIIEDYLSANDSIPPNSILSRLSTYILLDILTDSHPDKMARDEYPIMSYGQTGRYFARNMQLSDEPFSQEDVMGSIKESNDKGDNIDSVLINHDTVEKKRTDWRLFISEVLTEREVFIVDKYYEHNYTYNEIASEIGVTKQRIGFIMSGIHDKLRELLH